MTDNACPCGGKPVGTSYDECCRRYVADGVPAPTCEELMRSRYTAFVVGDADHLWRTWHPRTRPAQIGDLSEGTWLGLEVVAAEAGGLDDDRGMVEFVAWCVGHGGISQKLHEKSRFERRAGRWFYVDGDELD